MLPLTNAEKNLIRELTEFRKNALTALERISEGFNLATKISGNENDENILRVSNAISRATQLVSDFKICEESDTLWIFCKANGQTLYYRDSTDTPITAKNLMFALMSFEKALVENINIIDSFSDIYVSTLLNMKTVLHKHITDYVKA